MPKSLEQNLIHLENFSDDEIIYDISYDGVNGDKITILKNGIFYLLKSQTRNQPKQYIGAFNRIISSYNNSIVSELHHQ